ncbi:MAG: DUF3108 domain-containing protein [Steroidobacteraceae bacterium]
MPLLIALLIMQTANGQAAIGQSASAQNTPTLTPYTALYNVKYRGLSGGDIEFTLQRQGTDRYLFSSHLLPNFLGNFFSSDQAKDTSLMLVQGGNIKPLQFRSEDGSKKTEKDIRYDFDWSTNSVSGRYKDQDFTLMLPPGVQDRLSIQLMASLALQAGREPGKLHMLERNEVQEYTITKQGAERISTHAGEFDTVVLQSNRTDSDRSTRYWYAAKLGYIPVRAERTTKGKVDIVMELKSVQVE